MEQKFENLTIRPFAATDRPLVEDFFSRLGAEGTFFFNRNHGNERHTLAWFEGESRNSRFFLAEYEGRMVGLLFFNNWQLKTPWLGIAVSEDAKGCHVGTRLMAYAEETARRCGKGAILLITHQANIRGQGLYEKSGYTRLGVHTSGEVLYIRYFEDKA